MKQEKSQIIETVKKVMPSVVSVVISKDFKELEKEIAEQFPMMPFDPHFNIPPEKIDAHGRVQVGGGSGFIVDEKGIILTNKHVIAEPHADYTVITTTGDRYPAKIMARDPVNDVAILKIEPAAEKLQPLELGDSDHLELGQSVLAIGNALGIFKNTVSLGIISGLSRSISAQAEPTAPVQEMRGLIQTDAAINPGNSGGPLVDVFGRTVGINAAIVFGAQNIGFAIPVKAAERDLHDLKKYGRIRRPLLGIRYLVLNPDIKEKLKLPVDYGALIVREHPLNPAVIPGSPAAKAGLDEKDVILEWNGKKITQEKTVQDYLETCEVGENVKIKVLRNKKEIELKLVLAERK